MTNKDGKSSATSKKIQDFFPKASPKSSSGDKKTPKRGTGRPKASPKSSSGDKKRHTSQTSPKAGETAKQTKLLSEQYAENAATPEGKELRKFCTKLSLTEKEVQDWFTRKRATDSKAKDEKPKKKPKVAAGSNPKDATAPGPKIGANIPKKAFASKPSAANLAAAAKAVEDLFGTKGILATEGSPGAGDVATLKRKYDELYGKFGVAASEASAMQKQLKVLTKAVAELKKK